MFFIFSMPKKNRRLLSESLPLQTLKPNRSTPYKSETSGYLFSRPKQLLNREQICERTWLPLALERLTLTMVTFQMATKGVMC